MINSSDVNILAKDIYTRIKNSNLNIIELDKYCAEIMKDKYPNLSDLEISDELDKIIEKVKFYIKKEIKEFKDRGIAPDYEFNNYPPNVLLRYSLKHEESPLIASIRKERVSLQKAINEMHWQSFECFCKYLLESDGVSPLSITKVNQEGIDFCGFYNIGKLASSVIIPNNFKIRIVGQVKHYSRKINPQSVRAFNTYCEDVKNEEENIIKDLPCWFTKHKTPVLGIFMTTSDFTRSAIEYANKEWVLLKKGEQIVECLIKSPANKNWFSKDGRFSKLSFLAYFNEIVRKS